MVLSVGTGHFHLHNCLWMIKVIMSRTTAPSFTDSLLESTDALICSIVLHNSVNYLRCNYHSMKPLPH